MDTHDRVLAAPPGGDTRSLCAHHSRPHKPLQIRETAGRPGPGCTFGDAVRNVRGRSCLCLVPCGLGADWGSL